MKLHEKIRRELARMTSSGGGSAAPVIAEDDAGRFACRLDAVDAIGCAFREAEYDTQRLTEASLDQLQRIADQLASRVNYLLEPLGVVEWDAQRREVQLRSSPPRREEAESRYYEVLVHRGGVCLRRYAAGPGRPRRAIGAHVTHEVLGQLAEDMAKTAEIPPPNDDSGPDPPSR